MSNSNEGSWEDLPKSVQEDFLKLKIKQAGDLLLQLPYVMYQSGNKTFTGFHYYLNRVFEDNPVFKAYYEWLMDPSEKHLNYLATMLLIHHKKEITKEAWQRLCCEKTQGN